MPATRGVKQSLMVESILEGVKELVDRGYKRVMLLGQNIVGINVLDFVILIFVYSLSMFCIFP